MGVHRRFNFGPAGKPLSHMERYELILISSLPQRIKEVLFYLNYFVDDCGYLGKNELIVGLKDLDPKNALDLFFELNFYVFSPAEMPTGEEFIILYCDFPYETEDAKKKACFIMTGNQSPVRADLEPVIRNPHITEWENPIVHRVDIEAVKHPSIVTNLALCPPSQIKGVYFLLDNEVVVYIGMSKTCISARLKDHARRSEMKFNAYTIVPAENLDGAAIDESERKLIKTFRPKYNKTFTGEPSQIRIFDIEVAA